MPTRLHIRRCRRTDLPAVMRLLAAAGTPLPVPDRRTLHRFRRLVADLGSDLYLALVDDDTVGLLHVTYARQLVRPPLARVECLLVSPAARRRGIGRALLGFAEDRARRRGCGAIRWSLPAEDPAARHFAENAGLLHTETTVSRPLQAAGNDREPE